jgi:hypothetical protein
MKRKTEPSSQPWNDETRKQALELAKPILESDKIRNSDGLTNVLEHFIDNAGSSEPMLPVSISTAVWREKNLLKLKVCISRLRKELERYFLDTTSGRALNWRLEIPDRSDGKPYELNLLPNHRDLRSDLRFWDAYTAEDSLPLIVYTQPLFFWDKANRIYFRFLDVNHADQLSSLAKKLEAIAETHGLEHPVINLEPCYQYLSIGESRMIRYLQKWFRENWVQGAQLPLKERAKDRMKDPISERPRTPLDVKSSREVEDEIYHRNVIVLGNTRTNQYMNSFHKGLQLQLGPDQVLITKHGTEGVPGTLTDREGEDGSHYAYVIVTRIPNREPLKWVTMLAANNGIAGCKVVESLTSEEHTKELFSKAGWSGKEPLPARFQMLFEVKITESVAYVAKFLELFVIPEAASNG